MSVESNTTFTNNNAPNGTGPEKEMPGQGGHGGGHGGGMHRHMSPEEHSTAQAAARFGYGPLSHVNTDANRLPAFGGEFQPGTYKQVTDRKFANPAPLGLCAFALTTFVLGLINMGTAHVNVPNLVVGLAFGYGGLVQLLAGMWYVFLTCQFRGDEANGREGRWLWATPSVLLHSHLMVASGYPSPSS